jgi:glutathione-specific gamma-glutamylcyclotransferase
MTSDTKRPISEREMRDRLTQGTLLKALRADPPPGIKVKSDVELEKSLRAALSAHDTGQDIHVFGYGSLMWNPALEVVSTRVARVGGWHRRFCLHQIVGRGTPREPGAMLALDKGGACRGVLYRIAARKAEPELRLLWQREMLTGSYDARWVWANVDGWRVRALTFVVDRAHERYIGRRSIEHITHLIRTGQGSLGTSRAYFDSMVRTLDHLGIADAGIERIRRVIRKADEECVSSGRARATHLEGG